ncbi:MAG: hypothetical protein MUC96_10855 [Myxococcaceae bacterium]|jgi:hypothetical protein|nr:hypothetical protein [Myxococcaceae bacterium]
MRRREVLLILGVLGPFLTLVTYALWPRAEPADVTSDERRVNDSPSPPSAPAPPPATDAGLAAVAAQAPTARLPPPPAFPRALEAPLRAVTPEVMRCFDDQRAHVHDVQRLEVRFRPLPDGGFSDVRVPSTGNPYLAACIEDVFEELGFAPSGAETFEVATHRFEFDPDAGARPR